MTSGRRPMDRYTVTVLLEVDLGALSPDNAEVRATRLVDDVAPQLAATIRHHRKGKPALVGTIVHPALIRKAQP